MNAGHPADRGERPDREWPEFVPIDPWHALSQVIAGVVLWGLIGWGASRLFDVRALIGLGLVIGGAMGVLAVYLRYGREQSGPPSAHRPVQTGAGGAVAASGATTDAVPTVSPVSRPDDTDADSNADPDADPDADPTAGPPADPSTPDESLPTDRPSGSSPADHSQAQEEKQ